MGTFSNLIVQESLKDSNKDPREEGRKCVTFPVARKWVNWSLENNASHVVEGNVSNSHPELVHVVLLSELHVRSVNEGNRADHWHGVMSNHNEGNVKHLWGPVVENLLEDTWGKHNPEQRCDNQVKGQGMLMGDNGELVPAKLLGSKWSKVTGNRAPDTPF